MEKENKTVNKKPHELMDEDVKEVSGGYKYIGNNKSSLNKGDCFREGFQIYKVKYDYPELDNTLVTTVFCDQYQELPSGKINFLQADVMFNIRALDKMEYLGIDYV